jgi:hypothetical protein
MRRFVVRGFGHALLVGATMMLAVAVPGTAVADDTNTTFTVSGGSLTLSAPASAALGTGAMGATLSVLLGTTTVSDQRGALVAAWTATASASTFTTGGGTAPETIANSSVDYCSGAATASTGAGTFTPGQATCPADVVTLAASRTAFTLTGGSGANTASWNPTVRVRIPATAVAGAYSGTVTQSVA